MDAGPHVGRGAGRGGVVLTEMSDDTPASAQVVERWGDGLLEALEDPEQFHAEISMLSPAIANVICVELLDWQVRNGGFHQYFYNPYGITIDGAVRGFEAMGLIQCARIAREACAKFGAGVPEDRDDRIALVGDMDDEKISFNEEDDAYYALDMDAMYAVLDTYATAAMNGQSKC